MRDFYMTAYQVKGIKTLDQMVSLSFYQKTIKVPVDTQRYNIKGIYGMNGAGKSAIVTSVDILKSLLTNPDYLKNPMVQKNLGASINKQTGKLDMAVDFLLQIEGKALLYRYEVTISKNALNRYEISDEKLAFKKAGAKKANPDVLLEIHQGEITQIYKGSNDLFADTFVRKTANLLSDTSMSSLFMERIFTSVNAAERKKMGVLFDSLLVLYLFGSRIYVYMDQADNHTEYFLDHMISILADMNSDDDDEISALFNAAYELEKKSLNVFSVESNRVSKKAFAEYERSVSKLQEFIQIFKSDLTAIDIDKKEDGDYYICNLNMVYGTYTIDVEFESTGIKKLVSLFAYLQKMVQGGIVFIDELDSNLHDVYLCALLEYLMDYGEGQLCFTTHNVGPMDILKKHAKSIDFLSVDHKIYSWTTNGNYSPSKLYRNGMIEGSPFNVDSIDFIGVFDSMEE